MASSIPSFLFGAGTKYKTQEELDRAREQVKALLGDIGESKFTGWGSALADLGKGISARVEKGRIGEGQEGLEAVQGPFSQTLAEIAGGYGGADPDAIVATSGADTAAGGVGGDIDTGANARSVDLSGDKAAFVSALMPAAVEHGARIGVDPRIIVAQAAQETGWGKHAPGNNYFGIKSHGKGGGKTFSTEEVINGKRVRINDSFRQFSSPADSVAGYADFLASNKRYGPMRSAQGLDAQLRALGASGYATDPNYAASVGAIARSLPLVGGGGASGQAGGGVSDSFLQAKPKPAAHGLPPGARPGTIAQGADGQTYQYAQVGGGIGDANAPQDWIRFNGAGGRPDPIDPRIRGHGNEGNEPEPSGGFRNVPVNDAGLRTPAGVDFLSRMGNPAPMGGQPVPLAAPGSGPLPPRPIRMPLPAAAPAPTQPLAQPNPDRFAPQLQPVPPVPRPVPAPPPAPAPAPAPVPPAPPAPPPQVDPFTDMILGDKAGQFKPGNYIPPAPVGQQVFPAAPPALGTPAAAGFGVPPVVGGGGAERLTGQGRQQRGGGPQNVIGKLMTILASPYASDEQKRMATAMLSREYALEDERRKAASPEAQLDVQYKQAQIDKLNREAANGGSDETFFGNPILINKPGGGTAYGIYGNKGTFKEIQLPEGTTVAPPTKTIDTETETVIVDQAGNVISRQPKNVREAAREKAAGGVEGKTEAEVAAELSSIESKMPGLHDVVTTLGKLADEATYTQGGQMLDYGMKQLGMDPRDAAVARAQYNATVSNQILPLLRDTFGPQFTAAEGIKLEATLGDPDMSPTEKHAVLSAFIQQKERDIAALRTRKDGSAASAAGGAGNPPEGVSQAAWDNMPEETRKRLWPSH